MIFVDTSVWVRFLRGGDRRLSERLSQALDRDEVAIAAVVRVEILSGVPSRSFHRLRRYLSALPVFFPSRDTWKLIDDWLERAVQRGEHFGVGDLLVGATASERGGTIWSLDRDFVRMAKLGLVSLYRASQA